VTAYSSRDPATNRLTMFKGKAVVYHQPAGKREEVPAVRSADGTLAKIWFPDGPPAYTAATEAVEGAAAAYVDQRVLASWRVFLEQGRFADGVMPATPPKREWCRWDF